MEKRLASLLVESGAARMEDVSGALRAQAGGDSRKLGDILLAERLVKPEGLARALGVLHEVPFTDLEVLDPEGCKLLTADYLAEIRMVPFKLEREEEGERLHLAVEDPADFVLVDELRYQLRRSISVHVAPPDRIEAAIDRIRRGLVAATQEVPQNAAPADGKLEAGASEDVELEEEEVALVGELIEDDETDTAKAVAPTPPPSEGEAPDPLAVLPSEWEVPLEAPPNLLREPPPAAAVFDAPAAERVNPPEPAAVPVEAAASAPSGSDAKDRLDFSEADLAILDALEKIAGGDESVQESEKVKPARMVAALTRLLMKKGLIDEHEFLDELSRK